MANDPSKKQLTSADGRPIGDNQNSLTAGPRGHTLIMIAVYNEQSAMVELLAELAPTHLLPTQTGARLRTWLRVTAMTRSPESSKPHRPMHNLRLVGRRAVFVK